jgi:membrane associated rhomboid family serine protease
MEQTQNDLLEIILRECASARPNPWYPGEFAKATGLPREGLDACLDRLRLNGLLELTPWVQGHGQGYRITAHGGTVLETSRLLSRLRQGEVPEARPEPAPVASDSLGLRQLRGEQVRSALLDDSRPVITQALIAANVVWFLVGGYLCSRNGGAAMDFFQGGGGPAFALAIHETGSLDIRDVVTNGEWWRLLSYGFVHVGGLLHIAMNMLALFSLGPLLERMWGRYCYPAMYFASCAAGGAGALLLQPDSAVGGASGAICGLLGSMGAWVFLNRRYMPQQLVAVWQRNIVMNVILLAIISSLPGISWAGHLGGFVAGAVVSVPLSLARFGTGPQRWLGWTAFGVTVAVCGLLVVPQIETRAGRFGVVRRVDPGNPATVEEVDDAWKKEVATMLKAEEIVGDSDRLEAEVLRPGAKRPNPAAAKSTQKELLANKEGMERSVDILSKAKKRSDPTLARFLATGLACLEESAKFCGNVAQAMEQVVDPGNPWPPLNLAALRTERAQLLESHKAFKKAWEQLRELKQLD